MQHAVKNALQIPTESDDSRHGRQSEVCQSLSLSRSRTDASSQATSSMPARTRTAFRE